MMNDHSYTYFVSSPSLQQRFYYVEYPSLYMFGSGSELYAADRPYQSQIESVTDDTTGKKRFSFLYDASRYTEATPVGNHRCV